VRSLTGEIGQEYNSRSIKAAESKGMEDADTLNADLISLCKVILPFHLAHNAEAEAVDLLVEVQQLPLLLEEEAKVDANNYRRICLYLLRSADFMADPEDLKEILTTSYTIYTRQGALVDALRVALRMSDHCDDMVKVKETMAAAGADDAGMATKQQMALILARHRVNFEDEDDSALSALVGNSMLSECFLNLARDVDVMEPKTPEDIYKSHLADTAAFVRRKDQNKQVDSAVTNLANTFVNGFVNCGFGNDKLMTPEDSQWYFFSVLPQIAPSSDHALLPIGFTKTKNME
jgi:26S proteasome regulatory subunit N1